MSRSDYIGQEEARRIRERCGLDLMSTAAGAQLLSLPGVVMPGLGINFPAWSMFMALFALSTFCLFCGAIRFVRYYSLPWGWVFFSLFGVFGLIPYRWVSSDSARIVRNFEARGFEIVQPSRRSRLWKMMVRVKLSGTLAEISSEPISLDLPRGASPQLAAKTLGRLLPEMDVSPVGVVFRVAGKQIEPDDELHEGDELEIIGQAKPPERRLEPK